MSLWDLRDDVAIPPPPPRGALPAVGGEEKVPGADASAEEWRKHFIMFYESNAPSKVDVVTDALMDKWQGKYEELYTAMQGKYGPLGQPKALKRNCFDGRKLQTEPPGKVSIADWHDEFVKLIAAATPEVVARPRKVLPLSCQTSGFTVCARIRAVLPHENEQKGEYFVCVAPGKSVDSHCEEALLFLPKVGMTGAPKLETTPFAFDHVFGLEEQFSDDVIFATIGRPLLHRAKAGQVGVIFAYGQTCSGKTHTMNNLMDRVGAELLDGSGCEVSFSYFEILGSVFSDCLVEEQPPKGIHIGEDEDGSMIMRGLSTHPLQSPADLERLFSVAKAKRMTAPTEANDTSSRSHGVAVLSVVSKESGQCGVLYIIDLAGSERLADSKSHSKARLEETKQINLSLMALKECMQARSLAGVRSAKSVHVPYRKSKLTMLLKDIFDASSPRVCTTVVLACVTPWAKDVSHSANTLKYAAPLREALGASCQMAQGPAGPSSWTHEQVCAWLKKYTENAEVLCEGLTGAQLCAMPKAELTRRVAKHLGVDNSALATAMYTELCALVVDAKRDAQRHAPAISSMSQPCEHDPGK